MNTSNFHAPNPVVRESRLHRVDGSDFCIRHAQRQDAYNLTTGDVHVARIIRGVRYDTARAVLIAGHGEMTDIDGYELHRLYRYKSGSFFYLSIRWAHGIGFVDVAAIELVEPEDVLALAKRIVREQDVLRFLLDWYCAGHLPKDDPFVQQWAEDVLPADDCEAVQARLSRRTMADPIV